MTALRCALILLLIFGLLTACDTASDPAQTDGDSEDGDIPPDGDEDGDQTADGDEDGDIAQDGDDPEDGDTDEDGDDDVDGDEPSPCEAHEQGCDGSVAYICVNGLPLPIGDCARHEWGCEAGLCVATGEETQTEERYRTLLNTLRHENAREPLHLDRFGGWINAPEALGEPVPGEYFRIEKRDGAWWFITPEGHPFVSKGVTDVNYLGATLSPGPFHDIIVDKYGDEETWIEAAKARMQDWGYNTIGPWSSWSITGHMPHASVILDSAGHAPRHTPGDIVTDFWTQGFEDHTYQVAVTRATPFIGDENFLGYFLDNEAFWGGSEYEWRGQKSLLQLYLEFPSQAPGRVEALRFVREAAADLDEFNATWGTTLTDWEELDSLPASSFTAETEAGEAVTEAFLVHAFHRYAQTAIAGLRAVDEDHLLLGCRFAFYPGDALIRASAQYFDVISLAGYHENWVEKLDAISAEVDKPFLIEEFSFKAKDSGLYNIQFYAPVVDTQKDRALAYEAYVREFMSRPYAVAYHWYKWMDNPARPEDILSGDNFGLLNYLDEPYQDFVSFAREVNLRIEPGRVR